ncbi:MAG TPA: hypothetical protein VFR86_09245, partial [Burkholderiaceae bacterium]|nr:hypothetical protein [Burkholderiaceae bacterium]
GGSMNQLTVNQPTESLMALALCNLDAYRQVARVTLDSTERLEKIGIAFARNVVDKSFAVAETAGNGDATRMPTPDLNDWLRAQREIGDTLVNASQQLARTMTDYGNRLNETLSGGSLQAPFALQPPFNPDMFMSLWNQTYERYGEMLKGVAETVEAEAPRAAPATPAARPQKAEAK